MRAALKLECIGDHVLPTLGRFKAFMRGFKIREAWCAKLVSYDRALDKFEREFQNGQRDWSKANSKGSRGVMKYFWLSSGSVYEVNELTSWKKSRRWFAAVSDAGEIVEISRDQAILCLS